MTRPTPGPLRLLMDMDTPPILVAQLAPSGTWADPCDVVCRHCQYRETAPTMLAAQVLAFRHDRERHADAGA